MDIALLNWIQQFSNEFLDKFFVFFTRIGDYGELWILICIIFLLFKRTRKAGILGLLALLIEAILVMFVLKPMFDRPRPYITYNFPILIPTPSGSSFPSGHTAASFAVAIMLYLKDVPFKRTIMGLAALMSYSRLYLYVHYPSDILGGFVIALVIALLLKHYEKPIIDMIQSMVSKIKSLLKNHH